MFTSDQNILELKALRNELESYSYELRTNLQEYGNLEKYAEPSTRTAILANLDSTVDWLYTDEGKNASRDAYKQKLDDFKTAGVPINERFRFYTEIPIYMDQYSSF